MCSRLTIRCASKKRPLSLLEVIIALALTSILVTFLFMHLRDVTIANTQAETRDIEISAIERVEMRLRTLFDTLDEGEEKPPIFYTPKEGELIFSFNNGVDKDPLFAGKIRAELIVQKNQLELHLFPLEGEEKKRTEVLLDQVKSLGFSFFHPGKKEWDESWEKTELSMPLMMKAHITREDKSEIRSVFFLPPSTKPVVYK